MKDALDKLKVENTAARALLVKCGTTVERLVAERPTELFGRQRSGGGGRAGSLNVLKSEAVAQVDELWLSATSSATRAPLPSRLRLRAAACRGSRAGPLHNQIGDAGMQALASAFAGGAFRELEGLSSQQQHWRRRPRCPRRGSRKGRAAVAQELDLSKTRSTTKA